MTELESRNCQNRMEVGGPSSVITKLPSRPRLPRPALLAADIFQGIGTYNRKDFTGSLATGFLRVSDHPPGEGGKCYAVTRERS